MADVVPEGEIGVARVEHLDLTLEEVKRRSAFHANEWTAPGRYTVLYVHGCLMMSDTAFEKLTNLDFVEQATGDVLIAGLGLGMVLLPVLAKPDVTSVTVVELHQDVVDLVAPPIRRAAGADAGKLKIIVSDIMSYKPRGAKWDVVYFDIWPSICPDNLADMSTLHRRFARRARVWIDSWCKDKLVARRQRRRRNRFDPHSGRCAAPPRGFI
jgi:hypothetical protein